MTDDFEGLVEELFAAPETRRSDTLERPHIQGRVANPLHCEFIRDLTEADLEAMKIPGARGRPAKSLLRIHASHHALARCVAAGLKDTQAALVTGYSTVRVAQLRSDPAFVALVTDYREEIKSVFADFTERACNIKFDALELLQEKMHEAPETLTIPVLLDIIKLFADRTGHGPGAEVVVRNERDFIDRPPRESYEDWIKRRNGELGPPKVLN